MLLLTGSYCSQQIPTEDSNIEDLFRDLKDNPDYLEYIYNCTFEYLQHLNVLTFRVVLWLR